MLKVRRCKKCGGIPVVNRVGDDKNYFIIRCSSCQYTSANYDEASLTVKSAVRIWNKDNNYTNFVDIKEEI